MKLQNKETGEIGYLIVGKGSDYYVVANGDWESCGKYTSLAELNEEWKDIGCGFDGWNVKTASSEGDHLLINLYVKDCTGCGELLGLLFGGEE